MNIKIITTSIVCLYYLMQPAHSSPALSGHWNDGSDLNIYFDKDYVDMAADIDCDIVSIDQIEENKWSMNLTCVVPDTDVVYDENAILHLADSTLSMTTHTGSSYLHKVESMPASDTPDFRQNTWQDQDGPGLDDIKAWSTQALWQCYDFYKDETLDCPVSEAIHMANLFRSPGEKPATIFFVGYGSPHGGNAMDFTAAIFALTPEENYKHVTNVDGYYGFAEKADFREDALYLTTSTLTENDPRCCPTGITTFKVDYRTGEAVYFSGNK